MLVSAQKDYPEPSDVDLLERVAQREPEALLLLYRRYSVRIFSLIIRILRDRPAAEEILQDTFQRLWESYPLYDHSRGALLSWLFTVARNLALDYKRKSARRSAYVYQDDRNATEPIESYVRAPGGNAASSDSDLALAVVQAMDRLPPEQRSVVEMAYFEGLSHSELARKLDTSVGTVKSRLRLGLAKMRTALRNSRCGL
jgi:RNA polymerase sigma-70 factor (ECF subfamily)